MKKIYLTQAMSCALRGLDLKRFSKYFLKNGYKIVDNPNNADIIVLSTCAYSNERTNYSLEMVKKYLRYDAELVITGCLPEIGKDELKNIFKGKTVPTKNLQKMDEIFPQNQIKILDVVDQNIIWTDFNNGNKSVNPKNLFKLMSFNINRLIYKNNTLHYYRDTFSSDNIHYMRISRGCMGNCSYCAIKKAVGNLESKSEKTIIAEFKKGLKHGYKNYIFVADDLGAYGLDNSSTFPTLLNKIISIPGNYNIELRDIHPRWINKYIEELEKILKIGKIKTIFSPIQSGNNRILKLMNRYSNKERMQENFLRLKKAYKNLALGTDVIIGFPTETKEEHIETIEFIKNIGFKMGALLPYSCKTGTKAENINPKISEEEINKRMKTSKDYLSKYGYKVDKADLIRSSKVLSFRKLNN